MTTTVNSSSLARRRNTTYLYFYAKYTKIPNWTGKTTLILRVCVLGGAAGLLSDGLSCNEHNCSEEETGGPGRVTESVANNNQIIMWPKGAPALLAFGLGSASDGMKQLNNAEWTRADVYLLQLSGLFRFF